ncbi:hypothetical protein [Sphingobacterium hotanense]|uniref:Integrase catalytic domain-containing protein n=1 Tax=Sphingobacterium hotanense TaxID=649196 RepID=A0ABT7NLF0_9SPHI|nr:hypothetical protein [Sphingobacterium hotanense]MDM1048028.1 hypothetical protein [Sphingobacterium hotanense]
MINESPYTTYQGKIGVKVSFLITDVIQEGKPIPKVIAHKLSIGVCSYEALIKRAARTEGLRLRDGKGKNNVSLYSFENMDDEWQQKCILVFGDPKQKIKESNFLENYYELDNKASDFFAKYKLSSGNELSPDLKITYTVNASVLNAVIVAMNKRRTFRKSYGNGITDEARPIWEIICEEVSALEKKLGHTLKVRSLRRILSQYKKDGYQSLISGKLENQNTAKVVSEEQLAVLGKLLRKHKNFDNVQISMLYNEVAKALDWKLISDATVARYRKEMDLYIVAGNQGTSALRNTRSMQVRRKAPNVPMVYWTVDGWDVELLYQSTSLNKDGNKVTTYHNRPTCVMVLDPYLKYPIGYAIGTHETTALITEALRNAANHTKELFGQRYKSLQIQSDHYGKGVLTPIYEAMTKHYTPARVRNAKAKVVEPYFKEWNKRLQLMYPNWSGFGITSRKENQPNTEYLDLIKKDFPDFEGVCKQIIASIEMKRMELHDRYVSRWYEMADADHIPLTDEEYLYLFGETTGYTNRLHHDGLTLTLNKQEYHYDSFDLAFRENRHTDWCVKFDRDDMSKVLVVNAKSRNGRFLEEIGTVKFLLEEQYVQPMALFDRKDGDGLQLSKVAGFNRTLEEKIVHKYDEQDRIINQMMIETPALNGTLSKMILTDSAGQHKDQRNQGRIAEASRKLKARQEKELANDEIGTTRDREAYLKEKINLNDFIS